MQPAPERFAWDAAWWLGDEPRALYSADQPRVPAGSPDGGQWTDGASATVTPASIAATVRLDQAVEAERLRLSGVTEAPKQFVDQADVSYEASVANARNLGNAAHAAWMAAHPDQQGPLADPTEWRDRADEYVNLWASTSGDTDPIAVRMQLAVQRVFGLPEDTSAHLVNDVRLAETFREPDEVDLTLVRAEYARTQAFLKDHGITEVALWRGQRGRTSAPANGDHTITMQPASSWTTDRDIAGEFGRDEPFDHQPYVLSVTVPASRILSLPVTGRGTLRENEVLLLGGRLPVHVTRQRRGKPEEYFNWVDPELRGNYSADQPRVPAGSPDGGQWTRVTGAPVLPGEGDSMSVERDHAFTMNRRLADLMFADDKYDALTDTVKRIADRLPTMEDWDQVGMQSEIMSAQTPLEAARRFFGRQYERWLDTSGDSNAQAIRLQQAVHDVFGLDDNTMAHLTVERQSDAFVASQPGTPVPPVLTPHRVYVEETYKATQQWLKDHGITGYVTLYRGQSGRHVSLDDGEHEVTMQPATSWTVLEHAAIQTFGYARTDTDKPYLMTARVPVERIFSLPGIGLGSRDEGEVVVLGGPARVQVRRLATTPLR